MTYNTITNASFAKLRHLLDSKQIGYVELLQSFIARTEASTNNACTFNNFQYCLDKAKLYDNQSTTLPLAGLPLIIKANIQIQNLPCDSCSAILSGYRAPYTATCIKNLTANGAFIFGLGNMDEFGMGSTNEYSCYGPCKNPSNNTHSPGGSSGGSAAATSASLCWAALGSDTGGSVRQPASHCGIVGLRPTYGNISRFGLTAFANSLDQIGPLARSVEDCFILYNYLISGHDPFDETSNFNVKKINMQANSESFTFYYPESFIHNQHCDHHVIQSFNTVLEKISKHNRIINTDIPSATTALSVYHIISSAEAASNLNRFDTIRYGNQDLQQYHKDINNWRSEGFGAEVKRRIITGNYVLLEEHHNRYYRKAWQLRMEIKEALSSLLTDNAMLLLPTCPTTAPVLQKYDDDPFLAYHQDTFTVLASLAGLPAITIPMGSDQNNLPIGLQIVAKSEQELYSCATWIENIIAY